MLDIDTASFTTEAIKDIWSDVTKFEGKDTFQLEPSVQSGGTVTQIMAKL